MPHQIPYDLPADDPEPLLHRSTYILLGVFLGIFGVHNFYAGHKKRGMLQLGLLLAYPLGTIALQLSPKAGWQFVAVVGAVFLVSGLLLLVSIISDIITVRKDANGRWMR
jgi:uncharacterized membrane protein